MKFAYIILLVLTLNSTLLNAADALNPHHTCALFPNDNKEIKSTSVDSLKTKDNFELIIKRVTDMYTDTFKSLGGDLNLDMVWTAGEANASATIVKGHSIVYVAGGLYRQPLLTDDAFALVVCHELGHLLGGAPYGPGTPFSIEGQADFWASAVCIKKYFKEYPAAAKSNHVPSVIKCQSQYPNDPEARNICLRTAEAALSLTTFAASSKEGPAPTPTPELEKRDRNQRSNTRVHHPEVQCRLDTYVAGSLCELDDTSVAFQEKLINDKLLSDFRCNETVDGQITKIEKRPKCWLNESNYGYSLNYLPTVRFSLLEKTKVGTIDITYYNHLPGTYKIKLVPAEESAPFLEITTPQFTTVLPAAGETEDITFNYKLLKLSNKKVKFKVVVEYNGKLIEDKNNTFEIETEKAGLFN